MGGKTSTTTQSVQIPPEVMARYNAVNARAEQVAATPFQAYGGQFVAPITQTQQAGIQATGAASQLAQPFYGAATGLTLSGAQDVGPLTQGQIGYYQSPYTEAVAAPTYQALRQQQQQELAQQQAGAIRSGAAFGERSGLERANLMRQQALGTAQALAPIYQQGYGQAVQTAAGQQGVIAQDLARRMQAGQQIAGLGTGAQQAALQGAQAQIGAGTLEQQTQQADLTARYQQFLQERGYPFQVAQFLANIAMGTGALSGSTTTTTQPQPFFSDRRLKHDVKPIGKTNDGLPIYAFKYNGSDQTQIGLMAQDVEKKKPEAVGLAAGFKTVDYEKATEGSERKHKFYGGEAMGDEDMASMGGAVSLGDAGEAFARGGYAVGGGGGLLDATDLRSILAAQQKSFGPFSQAGLYGGQQADGSPMGGKSYVPKATLPVPKLITPSAAPRQAQSGLGEVMQGMKDVQGMTDTLSGLGSAAKRVAVGAPAVMRDGKVVEPAKGGLIGTGGKTGGGLFNPRSPNDVPVEKSGVALPVSEANTASDAAASPGFMDRFKSIFGMERGGVVPSHQRLGYAGLGKVIDPFEAQDPTKGVNAYIEDATEDQTDGGKGPGGGGGGAGGSRGGLGNDLLMAGNLAMMGAKLAPMAAEGLTALASFIPSDARLKDNIRRVGKTNDGQNIYAYDMGDGKTQLGLMAQEVLKRKPEAVGRRDGYLTLDYDKATEDAVKRASGGLVPRMGFQEGGPSQGMSEEEFNNTLSRAAEITRLQESGSRKGDYGIKGKVIPSGPYAGDQAYGAYQVMGKNVGPWTEKYLGRRMTPDEFLNDQKAQDDLFKAAWGENLRRYGNVPDAVSMWASGRPLQGNNTIDLVSKKPTTAYVNKFMAAFDPNSPLASAQESRGVAGPANKSFALQYLPTRKNERGEEEVNVKQMVIPALVGLGAMASSPSRYLGSAILQGLGAGAQSYAALEKQQQDIEASKAATEKIYAEIPSTALMTDTEGRTTGVRVYVNGEMKIIPVDEYYRALRSGTPYDLSPRPGQARSIPSIPTGEAKTGEIGAVETPAAPTAPGAPQAPKVEAPYRALPKEDQDLAVKNAQMVQQTGTTRLRDSASANPFDAQYRVAQDAASGHQQRLMFAKALGEIPRNAAAVSSGKFSSDVSTPIVTWVNSVLTTIGADPITKPSDLANAEVARKISTQLATMRTTEAGQRAYGALERILTAIPSQANTPEGAAALMADIFQTQQREIDLNRYLTQARNVAEQRTGINRNESRYIGDGLVDQFSRRMEQQYAAEKKILAELYMTKFTYPDDNGKKVQTYLMPYLAGKAGQVPPNLQKEIARRYGPNILRYFTGQ